ncbi:MAG TPA: O-antigen ligase family protein [Vicinamibacterales bacterium]|nr:O-antigen ligase family protein [Vicinamibacterales bacterium]
MAAVGSSAAPDRLEQSASLAMLAFVASLQISIAASNILLALTAILWIALLVRGRERIEVPPMFWPLAAYAAVSLVSAVFSIDPHKSFIDSKQLLLFAIVPIAYRLLAGTRAFTAVDVVISVAALSAAIGIVQFGILKWDDLHQRPQGALGMYMTYSGQLMLVACLAVARVLFWPRERLWPMLVLPALVVALATTASRNAWVGACSGIAILMLMRDFRLVGILPVLAAIFIAFAPAQLTDRFYAMFSIKDSTRQTAATEASVRSNQDRVAMIRSGIRIIKDHPLTGVGPDMVMDVYPVYRDKAAVNQLNPHLHNVPVQIAAERGLPALAVWLLFVFVLVRDFVRQRRTVPFAFLPNAGLAIVAAMMTAGMFEYNFGDSEFLMLFLLLVTLPSAAARGVEQTA